MSESAILIVVAIGILLLLSAFFSGSETALTAASRPRMHELEKQGDRRARVVNKLRGQQENLIGGILLGNNFVNILASALATSLLVGWFGDAGVAYATLAMTALILVFAEVLPKTYAIRNPDRLALGAAPVLRPVVGVLSPITVAVTRVVLGLLAVVGAGQRGGLSKTAREQELRGTIALHAGVAQEGVMLRSILDLAEVEVVEVMTHRKAVQLIDADASAAEIMEVLLSSPFTRLPLFKETEDNIVGVLHAKDVLRALRRVDNDTEKLDFLKLASLPWFIPESTNLADQLQAFRRRREHFSIVVDEYGSLMGVVTLEDILEEIVGDITDEHDTPVAGVRPQGDGSFIVNGTVTIRDLDRQFGWDLPDDEATTIAGLVLHEARLIPDVGQTFAFYGFRFDILRRQGNQITLLRVTPRPSEVIDIAAEKTN